MGGKEKSGPVPTLGGPHQFTYRIDPSRTGRQGPGRVQRLPPLSNREVPPRKKTERKHRNQWIGGGRGLSPRLYKGGNVVLGVRMKN